MRSKVIPRVGDEVIIEGKVWGNAARISCSYARGEGDSYHVFLEHGKHS